MSEHGGLLFVGTLSCKNRKKQAGAELGQAQLKLGLDFTPIFCRFGFSGFSFYFKGLIEKNWFGILGSLHFKHFAT